MSALQIAKRPLIFSFGLNGDTLADVGAIALEPSPRLAENGDFIVHSVGQLFLGSGDGIDLDNPDVVFELDSPIFTSAETAVVNRNIFSAINTDVSRTASRSPEIILRCNDKHPPLRKQPK